MRSMHECQWPATAHTQFITTRPRISIGHSLTFSKVFQLVRKSPVGGGKRTDCQQRSKIENEEDDENEDDWGATHHWGDENAT